MHPTMKYLLFPVVFFVLICAAQAQNFDANAETVSADYLLLLSMRGIARAGDYSVLPQPLSLFRERAVNADDPHKYDPLYPRGGAQPDDRIEQFREYIAGYYAPLFDPPDSVSHWLSQQRGRYRLFSYADSTARVAGEVSGMARFGTAALAGESSAVGLARMSARAIGSLGGNFCFMMDLSNGVRLAGQPLAIAQTDPVLGRTFKFVSEEQKFFDRYIGYVQYQTTWLRAAFGRQPLALGFSPIDNLLHSRSAPLFDALLLDVPYKAVRFTAIHGAIEGADTAGRAVQNKFAATHRLMISPAEWLSVAVTDMIVYSGRGLDFAYLNPLGFYVSTGLGTPQKSRDDNSMLALEAAVRPWDFTMLYAALLADDLSFSTLTDTSWGGNNNKYAWQVGVSHLLMAWENMALFTAEYTRVNPFVYSHRGMANSWTHLGAPLGYDMQPNSDRLAVQGKYWFSPRTFVQLDLDYTRHGENYLDAAGNIITAPFDVGGQIILYPVGNVGGNALRGDGDFLYPEPFRTGNRFMRGNVSHQRRLRLWFSAEPYTNIFADLRLNYQNRSGGNAPGDRFWTTLEIRVGY